MYNDDGPDGGDKVKIVLASTEQARAELDSLAGDYVAITDMLFGTGGNALPLPIMFDNVIIWLQGIITLSTQI